MLLLISLIAQGDESMASITIRNLDDKLKQDLRIRAAQHGRSMEEEVRVILRLALAEASTVPQDLGLAIHRRFAALGGVDLPVAPREPMRDPPSFDR
jgi:plasmid stability protein